MTQFITLAGRKQTGKDTSAQMIKDLICPQWTCEQVQADIKGYDAFVDKRNAIHIVHFADALKRACTEVFGISLEDMETEEGKQRLTDVTWPTYDESSMGHPIWYPTRPGLDERRYMTVREVLQFAGTELFRMQMDPDVWVKSVWRRAYKENSIVVVADCRFPNEAEFARENGLLISIERDTGLASDGHASEVALDVYKDYHFIIDNNGSFDDLREHLRLILKKEGFLS